MRQFLGFPFFEAPLRHNLPFSLAFYFFLFLFPSIVFFKELVVLLEISNRQGGSSLFNMDFASEGLSWVKGVCQTLETSCNDYVDACNKYVNTAGEHIRKIYEEVCDWENPYEVKGPTCGLELKHESITKVSKESSVELVNSSSEKLSACDQKKPDVSIKEDSDLVAASSEFQAQSHGIACDGDNDEPLSTGSIYCSDDLEESSKETSDTFTLLDYPKSSLREDGAQLLESHQDGGSSSISDTTVDKMGACRNDSEPKIGPYKLETPGQFWENVADIAEASDCRDDFTASTNNMLIQNLQTEEFGALTVEDFLDDVMNSEIALLSHCAGRNTSFKKRLKKMFISRKGYSLTNYLCEGIDTGMQNKEMSSASSVPCRDLSLKKSSSQESIDSEWELL